MDDGVGIVGGSGVPGVVATLTSDLLGGNRDGRSATVAKLAMAMATVTASEVAWAMY